MSQFEVVSSSPQAVDAPEAVDINLNRVTVERPGVVVTISEDKASCDEVVNAVRSAMLGLGYQPETMAEAGLDPAV